MANYKFSYVLNTVGSTEYLENVLVSVSHVNVRYSSSSVKLLATADKPRNIDVVYFLPKHRSLSTDTVTVSDSLSSLMEFGALPTDSITFSETISKAIRSAFSDSVTVSEGSIKKYLMDFDFDLSDSDVDPDPVTLSDAVGIQIKPIVTDSVTLSDSTPLFQFGVNPSDSVTTSDSSPIFQIGSNPSDSVTMSESLAPAWTVVRTASDSVTMSESVGKTITLGTVADSVTLSDSTPLFQFGVNPSDSVTMSEAINKDVTTADTESVSISDSASVINYNPPPTIDSWLNTAVISDDGFTLNIEEPYTGVIGGPGYIGQLMVNNDKITTGQPNAGLSLQFVYTTTMLNGYAVNATPFN